MLKINEMFHPFGMYQGANLIIAENERLERICQERYDAGPVEKR